MRALAISSLLLALVLFSGVPVHAQISSPTTFTLDLSLGSSGPQVLVLQKLLNQSPDTRIATLDSGSPGNETGYFGGLTQAAVMRFQQKYARQILVPAGLTQASGRVGSYTRAILNAVSIVAASQGGAGTAVTTPTTPATVSTATSTSQNPNLQNAPQLLAIIDSVGLKQGLSSDAIAKVNQAVLQGLATTTDLHAAFLKQAKNSSGQILGLGMDQSLFGKTLTTLGKMFNNIFTPGHAYAQAGTPFGGALIWPLYCTQSETWLIALTPLPPSYAVLLSYVPFTQAFLSYNIPATNWLLGFYEPGAGVCIEGICPYCVTIPNEGMISPIVGSSPT